MDTKWKFLLVALPAAILGFMLGPNAPLGAAVWPEPPAGPSPEGGTLGALMVIGVVEALAFGAGVAFLVFGRGLLARAPGATRGWAAAAYVAIAWGLVSWVPHTAMHVTNAHDDFARLVVIEYLFHLTLVVAAGVLSVFFWRILQEGSRVAVKGADAKVPLAAQR